MNWRIASPLRIIGGGCGSSSPRARRRVGHEGVRHRFRVRRPAADGVLGAGALVLSGSSLGCTGRADLAPRTRAALILTFVGGTNECSATNHRDNRSGFRRPAADLPSAGEGAHDYSRSAEVADLDRGAREEDPPRHPGGPPARQCADLPRPSCSPPGCQFRSGAPWGAPPRAGLGSWSVLRCWRRPLRAVSPLPTFSSLCSARAGSPRRSQRGPSAKCGPLRPGRLLVLHRRAWRRRTASSLRRHLRSARSHWRRRCRVAGLSGVRPAVPSLPRAYLVARPFDVPRTGPTLAVEVLVFLCRPSYHGVASRRRS